MWKGGGRRGVWKGKGVGVRCVERKRSGCKVCGREERWVSRCGRGEVGEVCGKEKEWV